MEMICMWKRGLEANPLIIKLDRSLMAGGSQEAVDLFPLPYAAIKYPIYGIELQCSFTLHRGNWSVNWNCYGVSLRISVSEKLNPQA